MCSSVVVYDCISSRAPTAIVVSYSVREWSKTTLPDDVPWSMASRQPLSSCLPISPTDFSVTGQRQSVASFVHILRFSSSGISTESTPRSETPLRIKGRTVVSREMPAAFPQVATLPPGAIRLRTSESGVPPTVSIAWAYSGRKMGLRVASRASRPCSLLVSEWIGLDLRESIAISFGRLFETAGQFLNIAITKTQKKKGRKSGPR